MIPTGSVASPRQPFANRGTLRQAHWVSAERIRRT